MIKSIDTKVSCPPGHRGNDALSPLGCPSKLVLGKLWRTFGWCLQTQSPEDY